MGGEGCGGRVGGKPSGAVEDGGGGYGEILRDDQGLRRRKRDARGVKTGIYGREGGTDYQASIYIHNAWPATCLFMARESLQRRYKNRLLHEFIELGQLQYQHSVLFGSCHTFELVQLPVPILIFFQSIVLAFAEVARREECTEIWTAITYRAFIARSTWWIDDGQSGFVEVLACDT